VRAHVPVPAPLVLVATLLRFRPLMDLQIPGDLNLASTCHNLAFSNATYPMSTIARNRARTRARGTGHRRRCSKSHISRSSVYETIEEEMGNASSPAQSKTSSPTTRQPIFVVDSDTVSVHSKPEESTWGTWGLDTPFSLFALQSRCCFFYLYSFCLILSSAFRNASSSGTFCSKLPPTSF
jgi:hypothetical protein